MGRKPWVGGGHNSHNPCDQHRLPTRPNRIRFVPRIEFCATRLPIVMWLINLPALPDGRQSLSPPPQGAVLTGKVMGSGVLAEVDFIDELRLRRWARENYVLADERNQTWHPIILEEMRRKDGEVSEAVLVG